MNTGKDCQESWINEYRPIPFLVFLSNSPLSHQCRPHETEFVTETHPTGQVRTGDVNYVESGPVSERIVAEAKSKPACDM